MPPLHKRDTESDDADLIDMVPVTLAVRLVFVHAYGAAVLSFSSDPCNGAPIGCVHGNGEKGCVGVGLVGHVLSVGFNQTVWIH
jgi:hypothetical protein